MIDPRRSPMNRRNATTPRAATNPFWLRLLLEQSKKATGLTIPFLIGSARPSVGAPLMDQDAAFSALAFLLTEMRDSTPSPYRVRIGRCAKIHEPIAAVPGQTEQMVAGEEIASPTSGSTALHVEGRYCPNRQGGLDSVLDYFWELYRRALINGDYSLNNGTYGPFTTDDLDFIVRVRT